MYGLGSRKTSLAAAVDVVEPLGDVAGDLQVLLLVLADRHDVGVVEQDVGRLEHRVGEEPVLGGEPLLDLVLVADALLQPAHRRDGRQEPGQLGRLGHVGLDEQRGPLGVEPQGEQVDEHVEDVAAELARRRGRWSARGSWRRSR